MLLSPCLKDMPSSAPLLGLLYSLCFGKQDYQGMVNTRMQRVYVTALGSWDFPLLHWPWVMGHEAPSADSVHAISMAMPV